MKLRILAASTAALIAAATLVAAPAEAAGFGVTLKTSTSKADVNKTFTLSGKVTGTGSGKKSIIVQRKIGTAAWKNYSTITTRDTGTYSKAFTMASVGAKSFRVLVPKTTKLTTGTSNTVKVTGYTWVDLYDQRYVSDGFVQRGWYGELNGRTPPSKTLALSTPSLFAWRLEDLCDRVVVTLEQRSDLSAQTVNVRRGPFDHMVVLDPGAPEEVDLTLDDSYSVTIERSSGSGYVAAIEPRAHCSVTRTPLTYD